MKEVAMKLTSSPKVVRSKSVSREKLLDVKSAASLKLHSEKST